MKKFHTPELKVTVFAIEDVITVSGGEEFIPPEQGENQTPYG